MSIMRKLNNNDQHATVELNKKRIGQNATCIEIGDRSVVTKMKKMKITFRYVPNEKEYTPQELEQFQVKEEQLINYIIDQFLPYKAPAN